MTDKNSFMPGIWWNQLPRAPRLFFRFLKKVGFLSHNFWKITHPESMTCTLRERLKVAPPCICDSIKLHHPGVNAGVVKTLIFVRLLLISRFFNTNGGEPLSLFLTEISTHMIRIQVIWTVLDTLLARASGNDTWRMLCNKLFLLGEYWGP